MMFGRKLDTGLHNVIGKHQVCGFTGCFIVWKLEKVRTIEGATEHAIDALAIIRDPVIQAV